jgi:hypothetical protein
MVKTVSMNMHIAHQLSVRGREDDRQRNERPHLMPMPVCGPLTDNTVID